jgi:hypothetical protein
VWGFLVRGCDTKITACKKCRKIFSIEEHHISKEYRKVNKGIFITEANELKAEIEKKEYCLDLMYEQIFDALLSKQAKLSYIKNGCVPINLTPTESLIEYKQAMESIDKEWVSVITKDLTSFIENIEGWKVKKIIIFASCRIEVIIE